MAKQFDKITSALQTFIREQKVFFVATARSEGRINISPKGMDSLRILDANRVVWLNLTGSGNETAAHLLGNNRMTILFCAFEGNPLILRLYGTAQTFHERDAAFQEYLPLFPQLPGTRQIIEMNVDLVQTSCGYGIPLMDFQEERTRLIDWAAQKGKAGIEDYWKEKNQTSIDGFPSQILG
ncbi:MAG: pyridoxamine 5'-phosphate oxidase family protein [Bacteroidota bacterium]